MAASVEQIERSLRWLGIDWDGPTTFQLDRWAARRRARRLLAEGKAYEDDGAVRIRMPDEGVTGWDDAVKGRIEFPSEQLEDLVLLRSDGRPTYNFASPLEDWLDGITHVIRGDDHVSNTPKQIHVLHALGAEPPLRHVPNVFGMDGKKLSKRHGAVSVDEFREAGYVAPALLNFLALLGWSFDDKTTVMSRDELVERFSLERVGTSPATFDYAKLDWLNGVYLREMAPETTRRPSSPTFGSAASRGTRRGSSRPRRSSRTRSHGSASSPPSPASCSSRWRRPSRSTVRRRCSGRRASGWLRSSPSSPRSSRPSCAPPATRWR